MLAGFRSGRGRRRLRDRATRQGFVPAFDVLREAVHELRGPIASIYGAAMTLRRPDVTVDDFDRRRLVELIAAEAERMSRLLEDLASTGGLESSELPFRTRRLDAAEVAANAVDGARLQPATKDVVIELEVRGTRADVEADPDRIHQVLGNLLANAVRHTPPGRSVAVVVEPVGARVRFSVVDEGPGVPEHERARIFERFYRTESARRTPGTGLGLAVCRRLVEGMGGALGVESAPGGGSVFWFELPAPPATLSESLPRPASANV
jgi:signal transduction histidine kinase